MTATTSSTFEVLSDDGTRLRGWRNNQPGVPLVIANGLGTVPEAWPFLLADDSGYDALTWYQRGTFGSGRPADPKRIRVVDHVADMVALMDQQGVEQAYVLSWSLGVNMAFELALEHPDRVLGILAVAGVPGGTFATMGGPLRIPQRLRYPIATRAARAGRAVGPALTWLAPRLPVTERTAWVLRHSGFMRPTAKPEVLLPMLRQFVLHDWTWYAELALAAAEHAKMDLTAIRCPVTLVAGQHDLLTSMHDVLACGATLPHAEVTVLPGSHFLPLEHPDQIRTALDALTGLRRPPAPATRP